MPCHQCPRAATSGIARPPQFETTNGRHEVLIAVAHIAFGAAAAILAYRVVSIIFDRFSL